MKMVSTKTSAFKSQMIVNENYSLILVMFNCALLVHFLLAGKGIFFITVCILLFNYRLWVFSLINIFSAVILLAFAFPRQGNHANLELFIGLLFICLFVFKLLNLKVNITPANVSTCFRVFTVSVYFYAGFHKLNWDFFDTSVSCANVYGDGLINKILNTESFSLPEPLKVFFPYGTIFVEMFIPLGLLWYRSRRLVAILLLIFHLYLAMYSFANFSSFACFLLAGCTIDFGSRVQKQTLQGLKFYIITTLFCALLNVTRLIQVPFSTHVLIIIFGASFCIGAASFFFMFFKNYRIAKFETEKKNVSMVLLVFTLVSAWALKSYAGLGTSGNLTMFSNLVTERNRSNHLFINTTKTKIWDFEEDHVLIIKLDDRLERYKEEWENNLVPLTELSFIINEWNENKVPLGCTLKYQGKVFVIKDLKNSDFSNYKWWYKFVSFRAIQVHGPNKCRW